MSEDDELDAIVVIVAPPLLFEVGMAGGFRRLTGGGGAGLRCPGVGETGADMLSDIEGTYGGGVGRLADRGGEGTSCAGGENGEDAVTEITGGSSTNAVVSSSSIVGAVLRSFNDKDDISALAEPVRPRLFGSTGFAEAVATFGRLIELSLLPLRNVSPKRRSLLLWDGLFASSAKFS